MWAPGHFGLPTKFCKNCWKVLKTKEITQNWGLYTTASTLPKDKKPKCKRTISIG